LNGARTYRRSRWRRFHRLPGEVRTIHWRRPETCSRPLLQSRRRLRRRTICGWSLHRRVRWRGRRPRECRRHGTRRPVLQRGGARWPIGRRSGTRFKPETGGLCLGDGACLRPVHRRRGHARRSWLAALWRFGRDVHEGMIIVCASQLLVCRPQPWRRFCSFGIISAIGLSRFRIRHSRTRTNKPASRRR
jgi:hypothetical protein